MQRLVAIIAILFAFAALAGPALAHAHRFESAPIVVLNHVDADNVSLPVIVTVQKGNVDLGSGIIMPCGPYFAIPVDLPPLADARGREVFPRPLQLRMASWPETRLLRPPRAA